MQISATSRLVAATAAAGAMALTSLAAPAQANDRISDISGDAHGLPPFGASVPGGLAIEELSDDSVDILSGDIRYVASANVIRYTATLASLDDTDADAESIGWSFRYSSPSGDRYVVTGISLDDLYGNPTPRSGVPVSYGGEHDPGWEGPQWGSCAGCTHSIDAATNTVTVDVPLATANSLFHFGQSHPLGSGSTITSVQIDTRSNIVPVGGSEELESEERIDVAREGELQL